MKTLWFILGCLTVVAAVFGSLYVSLWLCLVSGIVQIVEACKATPVESMGIALGVVRVLITSLAGWACFLICALLCGVFFGKSSRR